VLKYARKVGTTFSKGGCQGWEDEGVWELIGGSEEAIGSTEQVCAGVHTIAGVQLHAIQPDGTLSTTMHLCWLLTQCPF
jgi:hypothetical protein